MGEVINYPLRYRRFVRAEGDDVTVDIVVYAPHSLRSVYPPDTNQYCHIKTLTELYEKEGYNVQEDGEFQCVRQADESTV